MGIVSAGILLWSGTSSRIIERFRWSSFPFFWEPVCSLDIDLCTSSFDVLFMYIFWNFVTCSCLLPLCKNNSDIVFFWGGGVLWRTVSRPVTNFHKTVRKPVEEFFWLLLTCAPLKPGELNRLGSLCSDSGSTTVPQCRRGTRLFFVAVRYVQYNIYLLENRNRIPV